ncbi:hypothetical protein F0562_027069 [Nyssa sinensis]|uniref:Uncharacterized protein n=1 Tax=Nyssa sinensis TaxID=561372 RepID=A0A5J5B3V9_9ASTE|nr:hypothetical protein F0562_027069 [Nyssa sinensis]
MLLSGCLRLKENFTNSLSLLYGYGLTELLKLCSRSNILTFPSTTIEQTDRALLKPHSSRPKLQSNRT